VTTKYQEAAKIANLALTGVLQQCVAGAKLTDLCKFGDTVITQVCISNYLIIQCPAELTSIHRFMSQLRFAVLILYLVHLCMCDMCCSVVAITRGAHRSSATR
jgi:hypothetical protein